MNQRLNVIVFSVKEYCNIFKSYFSLRGVSLNGTPSMKEF